MSIVSKEEYWTTILNDYSQFGQITTENSKFNSIANDVWTVLENSFIKIDDEESIIEWEEMTGLSGEGLTIFQRKVNILYILTVKNYLPISLFTQAMDRLVGEDNYFITFNEETQKYAVRCDEVYEASASFLNKRMGNGWVDLEITPLPTGYLAAEFLESTGTQYIDSGVKASSELTVEAVFVKTLDYSYQKILGAFSVTNGLAWVLYIQPSTFSYGSENIRYSSITIGEKYTIKKDNEGLFLNGKKQVELPQISFNSDKNLLLFALSKSDGSVGTGSFARLYSLKIAASAEKKREFIPAVDAQGVPCMFDNVSKQPFKNAATEAFIIGFTVDQARNLSKLPATGGTLTISLPWEAQLIASGIPAILQAAAAKGWTITVQYRDPEEDNEYYNRYAECETVADMSAVNADYKNDMTKDGEWVYPLPKAINLKDAFYNNSNLKAFSVTELPEVTDLHDTFIGTKLERIKLNVPKLTHLFGTFGYVTTLKWAEVQLKNTYPTDMLGSFRECSSLSHVRINLDHLRNSSWLFERCQLDKDSTLHILSQLRTFTDGGTHNLSIGIHTDLQTDEEVTTAIADAEAKGWTLTIQWTGTATAAAASTFGLRKSPIYAKLGTLERPNGTTENALDWGHYVTNWEENGYQEFSSVEEANEYFNIESETEQ